MGQLDTFAHRLKAARKAKKLTQQALANRAGITESMVSRYERGKHAPSADYVGKLAAVLGVTPNKLMGMVRIAEASS